MGFSYNPLASIGIDQTSTASDSAQGADGSVQFAEGGKFASAATELFWDNTNNRLGIGTNTPVGPLEIDGFFYFGSTGALKIGSQAGEDDSSNHITAVGDQAGMNSTGIRNTYIGFESGTSNVSGAADTYVGYRSGEDALGSNQTALGAYTLAFLGGPDTGAQGNTCVGANAMRSCSGDPIYNTMVGVNCGISLGTGGDSNVCVGHYAGTSLTTGEFNTFIGSSAGLALTTGTNNMFLGQNAGGNAMTSHSRNLLIGRNTGYQMSGEDNTVMGTNAGRDMVGGSDFNTIAGFEAMRVASAVDGMVVYGHKAGRAWSGTGDKLILDNQDRAGNDATQALVFGEFNTTVANQYVTIYGKLEVRHKQEWFLGTEDLTVQDAGSTSATEQDWIEVTVGGNTGYIRVFATK